MEIPDLGALKAAGRVDLGKVALALQRLLHESKLLCACGELVEGADAVEIVVVRLAAQGGQQTLQRASITFHSQECPALRGVLAELSEAALAMVMHPAPQHHWLVRPVLPEREEEAAAGPSGHLPGDPDEPY